MRLLAFLLALPLGLYAASPADKLVAFYARIEPGVDPGFLRYVAGETERLAKQVGQGDKTETLLAMWHVESHYEQTADDGDSYGIAQTRKRYENRLRIWWLNRGTELGSIDDPTTQVAFGVAEFVEHWKYAEHDRNRLWETVRRYNGSGAGARHHAYKVFKARKAIFGE